MKLRNVVQRFATLPAKRLSGDLFGSDQETVSSRQIGPACRTSSILPRFSTTAVIALAVAGTVLAGCENPFSSKTPDAQSVATQGPAKKDDKSQVHSLLDRLEAKVKGAEAALEQVRTENRTALEAAKKEADGVIAAAQSELTKAREEQGTLRQEIADARKNLDEKKREVLAKQGAVKTAESRHTDLKQVQELVGELGKAIAALPEGMDDVVGGSKGKAEKAAEHAKALREAWEAKNPSPEARANMAKALGNEQLRAGRALKGKVQEAAKEADGHAAEALKEKDPFKAQVAADMAQEAADRAERRLKRLQELAGGEVEAIGQVDALVSSAEEALSTAKDELSAAEEEQKTAQETLAGLETKGTEVTARIAAADQGVTASQEKAKGILQKAEEANSQRLTDATAKVEDARKLFSETVGKAVGGTAEKK